MVTSFKKRPTNIKEGEELSIEGLWTTEICGPFGWETVGVLVLSNGVAAGGNNNHFSLGAYRETGEAVEIELAIDFYGTPRSIFGVRERSIEVSISGRRENGLIEAQAHREGDVKHIVECRLRKRSDLTVNVMS